MEIVVTSQWYIFSFFSVSLSLSLALSLLYRCEQCSHHHSISSSDIHPNNCHNRSHMFHQEKVKRFHYRSQYLLLLFIMFISLSLVKYNIGRMRKSFCLDKQVRARKKRCLAGMFPRVWRMYTISYWTVFESSDRYNNDKVSSLVT